MALRARTNSTAPSPTSENRDSGSLTPGGHRSEPGCFSGLTPSFCSVGDHTENRWFLAIASMLLDESFVSRMRDPRLTVTLARFNALVFPA